LSHDTLPQGVRSRRIPLPARGGEIALYELGPEGQGVDIVFSHANGFNARTYFRLLTPLAQTRRIVALDMRGHGRTDLPTETEGRHDWLDLRDDLTALMAALEVRGAVLSGHSMGGTVSLLGAAVAPEAVRRVVLFEPVFMQAGLKGVPADAPLALNTLKRRAVFPDRATAMRAYGGRGAFQSWSEQALADYIADGFRDLPDGQVKLAADPTWEYSNYVSQAHDARSALAAVAAPVEIFQAETGSTCRLTPDELAPLAGKVDLTTVAGTTHFLPMERPDLFAEALGRA
jgi:pimeloyl-ACP methyl ester carboxylesterase